MTDVTVRQFADVVGLPVDRLMVQLDEAGLKISGADDIISDAEKMQLLSSKAEDKLARALCVNRSVIKLSLSVRGLLERRRIDNSIARNIDFLRQARRWQTNIQTSGKP